MSILIKDMDMPESCQKCGLLKHHVGVECDEYYICDATGEIFNDGYKRKSQVFINPYAERLPSCPLVSVPTPLVRSVDADELRRRMYRAAFETDTDMQKWDSGCWIRYKMFEQVLESTPTIIEAEGE